MVSMECITRIFEIVIVIEEIVNIMNVCLVNQRVSAFWKHCVISRIPKKNPGSKSNAAM